MTKAIGILGGTFDPIHHGHLRLATEALEHCSLQQVIFMPCGQPPHRAQPVASAEHRLHMAQLAVHGNARFLVDTREVFRPGVSYTVDTLTELRNEFGSTQPLALILGSDAFLGLPSWHRWEELFELTHFILMQRPGEMPLGNSLRHAPIALAAHYRERLAPGAQALHETPAGRIFVAPLPQLEISASDIRRKLASQHSVRYLLPDAVLHYLLTQELYPC